MRRHSVSGGLRLGVGVVEQPDAAITGIVVSFSLAPAVLIALSLLTLARYPLRRADIDHHDTESQST